jgi:translocation and assembly module TamB
LLGDASVEYLITPDGKYLLTAFRKNEYGSVIDGQLVITGISIVLNKEFNHFYEIFRASEDDKIVTTPIK